MGMVSENAATVVIVLIAFGILGWGYYRAKPFGKLGILAWLQSVVLMAPWLLFFGLFAAGIYLNLAGILLLLVSSTAFYIFLGQKLRSAGQDELLKQRLEKMVGLQQELNQLEANGQESPTVEISEPTPATSPTSSSVKGNRNGEFVPIPAEHLKIIQGLFGIDTFFATESIAYQDGAIFKGNMRGDPNTVHQRLSANLQERLGDRYRLFMVYNSDEKPVMIVLPSSNDPQPATFQQKILALILFAVTIATSLETGGLLLGFDLFNDLNRWQDALPLSLGLWAVLITHEIGHQVMARRHQVRFSWPFFIPTWQIGSFGALNRFESLLPNRQVLFDVAFAGPAAGGLLSLGMLITGLLLSHPGSMFQLPADFFQGSVLVGALAKVVLGSALQQPLVDIHPLAAIGWLGLVITAINLMPAGQLDGGRIVQAIYGRKIAGRATIATLIVLAIASFVNPIALYWAIVILFLQRSQERPSLNEISEPDDTRAALGLLALFLMIATLLPLSPGLAGRLGIGS